MTIRELTVKLGFDTDLKGITNTNKSIDSIKNKATGLSSFFRKFSPKLRVDSKQAEATINNIKSKIFNLKSAVMTTVATAGIGLFAKEGLELASNLVEVQNVVDTTFGDTSTKIDDFAKTSLKSFGISELQAKKFSGTIGAMMKSSGISIDRLGDMSTSLVGLAGDMSSFYNLSGEEAFDKLRAGISGETEPLKQLGVNMSVANLEAYALSNGITTAYQEMTQAEQVTLRYNYLMKATADAQGDFARTSDGYANQMRVFGESLKTFQAKVMSPFIPILTNAAMKMNEFFASPVLESYLTKFSDGVKKVQDYIASPAFNKFIGYMKIIINTVYTVAKGIADLLIPPIVFLVGLLWMILKPILKLVDGFLFIDKLLGGNLVKTLLIVIGLIIAFMNAMKILNGILIITNIIMSVNPFVLIIAGIVALIGAIGLLIMNWEKVKPVIDKYLIEPLQRAGAWIKNMNDQFGFLLGPIDMFISAIFEVASSWDSVIQAFKTGGILGALQEIGKALLRGVLTPIRKVLDIASKIPGIGGFAKEGVENIDKFIDNYLLKMEVQKKDIDALKTDIAKNTAMKKEGDQISNTSNKTIDMKNQFSINASGSNGADIQSAIKQGVQAMFQLELKKVLNNEGF